MNRRRRTSIHFPFDAPDGELVFVPDETNALRSEIADLRNLIKYLTVCRIAEQCGGVVDDKTKNMIADLRRKLGC